MRIPEVRDRLVAIAEHLEVTHPGTARELLGLADQLRRRPYAPRRRAVSRPMTPVLREQILEMRRRHPHLTQMEIAEAVGVNAGRVSETLHGYRE